VSIASRVPCGGRGVRRVCEHAFVSKAGAKSGPKSGFGVTRELVADLHAQGLTGAEIASRLGINRSTVVYHLRQLKQPRDPRFARRFDWEEIRRAYETGLSARKCREHFGCSRAAWADAVKRGAIRPRPRAIPIERLLVADSDTWRGHLKLRLIADGLKQARCELCGLDEWRGERLSIALHHVNGDGRDNRLENLQFLCPNCHSQTDTYGGRNGHRRKASHP
jgi:5-methylcytosine-specific restriction endonuclease McrA